MSVGLYVILIMLGAGFVFRLGWTLAGWMLAKAFGVFEVPVTITLEHGTMTLQGRHATRTPVEEARGE